MFVVGLSEDGYPGRLHEDALLNDTVRTATAGELQPVRARLDTQHRQLLAAFSAAPSVTASFPRGDLRKSTERLPSRFLLPSLREITDNKELPATTWADPHQHRRATADRLIPAPSFAHGVLRGTDPACTQEWQIRATASSMALAAPAAELLAAARELLDARESRSVHAIRRQPRPPRRTSDPTATGRPMSPTALESYAKCPHGYFVQRMLGVQPVEQPEEIIQISAADIGTLIHEAMDAMICEAAEQETLPSYGEPWSSSTATDCSTTPASRRSTSPSADSPGTGACGNRSSLQSSWCWTECSTTTTVAARPRREGRLERAEVRPGRRGQRGPGPDLRPPRRDPDARQRRQDRPNP